MTIKDQYLSTFYFINLFLEKKKGIGYNFCIMPDYFITGAGDSYGYDLGMENYKKRLKDRVKRHQLKHSSMLKLDYCYHKCLDDSCIIPRLKDRLIIEFTLRVLRNGYDNLSDDTNVFHKDFKDVALQECYESKIIGIQDLIFFESRAIWNSLSQIKGRFPNTSFSFENISLSWIQLPGV